VISCYLGDQKISAPSQIVATAQIAPNVCYGQPPTFGSQISKFHPNRFTFGGVIAGRVKAVKMCLNVFPILGEAIASRQVMNATYASSKRTVHRYTVVPKLMTEVRGVSVHMQPPNCFS